MSHRDIARIAVVGAGSWGTALANVAARAGRRAVLWGRDAAQMKAVASARENARYLPGVKLEAAVDISASLDDLRDADAILLVVPAQAQRETASILSAIVKPNTPVVVCAKGIERGTQKFMSDVISEELPDADVCILSGPSFAIDVAKALPTAVTIAAENAETARNLADALATSTFRLYHSTDVRGVEIGGAAKNVLAIACGVSSGRQLGASANAALIARGFAELRRFASAFGARPETLMGLSGLGDLVLTCSSETSRNFSFGLALGRGKSVADAAGGKLAEGALTAAVLTEMARGKDVEMPISEAVDAIISGRHDVRGAIESLLSRPQKEEI